MKYLTRHWWLLMAVASATACTYHVRESNVVIARAAPSADINALREHLPNYLINQVRVTTPDRAELYSVRFLRNDAIATVLYFGGNGYTLARLAPATVNIYQDAPVNVVLVDHRGYGGSTGVPTIDQLMSDAILMYEHVLSDTELTKVPLIVHGHSLGSFMAGHVAANRRLAGVVLESSVTSTEEWTAHLRSNQSAWIRLLVRRVVPEGRLAGRGNRDVASALDEPVLFVVGANDDVTPPRFAQELFDSTPMPDGSKHLLIVPGKNHMDATDSPEFRAAFSTLVAQVTARAAGTPIEEDSRDTR